MKVPLSNLVERLRASQWVIPMVQAIGAALLSAVVIKADAWAMERIPLLPWFVFSGSTEAARQLLGILSASLVSLTTITFSVTMIVLTLATNQFGPRVLRNFLQDHFNQFVLGTFVATLLFCLLLVGQLPAETTAPAPRIAVTLAVLFSVLCIFALLGFVHHTAKSIQTSNVVKNAADQLGACVERLFPSPVGEPREEDGSTDIPEFTSDDLEIKSSRSGYLQAIDLDGALGWAESQDTVIKLIPQPGDFIATKTTLITVKGAPDDTEAFREEARKWFMIGDERTGEQDARFGFRQLVEIAVRALSPGTNDPYTAINAIDYISSALLILIQRETPDHARHDQSGKLRLVSPVESFPEIADEVFSPLRHYGREHPAVIESLIKLLDNLALRAERPADKDWVQANRKQLEPIIAALPDELDRDMLSKQLQ